MNISIIDSGYIGLVQALALADVEHRVFYMNVDKRHIEQQSKSEITFYKRGL